MKGKPRTRHFLGCRDIPRAFHDDANLFLLDLKRLPAGFFEIEGGLVERPLLDNLPRSPHSAIADRPVIGRL
jgi:hypothetical protein